MDVFELVAEGAWGCVLVIAAELVSGPASDDVRVVVETALEDVLVAGWVEASG